MREVHIRNLFKVWSNSFETSRLQIAYQLHKIKKMVLQTLLVRSLQHIVTRSVQSWKEWSTLANLGEAVPSCQKRSFLKKE